MATLAVPVVTPAGDPLFWLLGLLPTGSASHIIAGEHWGPEGHWGAWRAQVAARPLHGLSLMSVGAQPTH